MSSSIIWSNALARRTVGVAVLVLLVGTWGANAPAATDAPMTPARLEQLLETYRGKVVLIDYWATWCPPCRLAAPELDELYRRYQEQGLEMIGVSFDRDTSAVRKFIRRYHVTYPVYLGTRNLQASKQVSVLPTTVLVARDGTVAGRFIGYLPQDALEKKIQSLLKLQR